jgi:outer membrane protein OmpA-like peptidoglycan-associated protein
MKAKRILFGVMILSAAGSAAAQSTVPIFRGEVTESELVNALTPELKLRSIRPIPNAPPPKPAAASLLITFKTNSTELTPRAKSTLDVVARALKTDQLSEFRFRVEGHADPRGNQERNLVLSQGRAESVCDYLAVNHGISRARLAPEGRGDREPLNRQDIAAPENRRVTIVNLGGS